MSGEGGWYYVKNGQTVGPMSREELIQAVPSADGPATLIWGPGVTEWTEARHIVSLGAGATHTTASPASLHCLVPAQPLAPVHASMTAVQ